jgi:RHS repeat-associated protein
MGFCRGTGAKPVSAAFQYDSLARLSRTDYLEASIDPATVFYSDPTAIPFAEAPSRIADQLFNYDWLDNPASSSDDLALLYDRSLGNELYGSPTNGPNQIQSTSEGTGSVVASHDAAGNLANLVVNRNGPCSDPDGKCSFRLVFDWDEVGQLARARRWAFVTVPAADSSLPEIPSIAPSSDLRFRYDSRGQRIVSSAIKADGSQLTSADVFETLRLVDAAYDSSKGYDDSASSERVQTGFGQIIHLSGLPRLGSSDQHMFLEFADPLGSTSAVIDKATGELVQRITRQSFRGPDSNYIPNRWMAAGSKSPSDDRPQDGATGLIYQGARYYHPQLGQWISPDPLVIHQLTGSSNPFLFADNQPSMKRDISGLDPDLSDSGCLGMEVCGGDLVSDYSPKPDEYSPITVNSVAPTASATAQPASDTAPSTSSKSPMWTGAMKLMVNASPVVLGFAMLADPERTLATVVVPRLEAVENLLGELNTTSDLSDETAQARHSEGQRALTDTQVLLSITEQEVAGAALNFTLGAVARQAATFDSRAVINDLTESCSGGTCVAEGFCFSPETLVATPKGDVPIKTIHVGDEVLSRDKADGEVVARAVTDIFVTPNRRISELHIQGDSGDDVLLVTDTHPFYVTGKGWTAVRDLKVGMHIGTATGVATVEGIRLAADTGTVFNLEVEHTHSYFVGHLRSWVHNACRTVYGGAIGPGMYAQPNGYIPLSGPGRAFRASQRSALNLLGDLYGCHTCGVMFPGTTKGNWVIDHQPPVAFDIPGITYRGYPQCAACGLPRPGGTSQPHQVLRVLRRGP